MLRFTIYRFENADADAIIYIYVYVDINFLYYTKLETLLANRIHKSVDKIYDKIRERPANNTGIK